MQVPTLLILYANTELRATIGFRHEVSIRYYKWNSDAELAKSDDLLTFLAQEGFTKPLEDSSKVKRDMEADRVAERKWLNIAPKSFQTYWTQINSLDKSYFVSLIKDLNSEFPEREKQIIVLLQTFGLTDNFWSSYPAYENLPNDILQTFETKDIITAYLRSDRNYKTRKGLGRYLCSHEFKKIRKMYLGDIKQEVIDDLKKCFEWLGEKRGINEIFGLQNEKNEN